MRLSKRINSGRMWKFLPLFLIFPAVSIAAQEHQILSEQLLPGLRERAVIMNISARIIQEDDEIVWDSEDSRITIPGRPVEIKLVGSNIIVTIQFTPFFRSSGRNVLVAQGQVWTNVQDQGVSYHTIMQTIPLEFDEEIIFFPLGTAGPDKKDLIEIQLVVQPYYIGDDIPDDLPEDDENEEP
jgi:hypothetical protein